MISFGSPSEAYKPKNLNFLINNINTVYLSESLEAEVMENLMA